MKYTVKNPIRTFRTKKCIKSHGDLSILISLQKWKEVEKAIDMNSLDHNVESLCHGQNINFLLHDACQCKPPLYVIKALLKISPSSIFVTDNMGHLPLHIAVIYNAEASVVSFLLSRHPNAATSQNEKGQTALHLLFSCNDCLTYHDTSSRNEISTLLCEACPESVLMEDYSGKCPIEYAVEKEVDKEIIKNLQRTSSRLRRVHDKEMRQRMMARGNRLRLTRCRRDTV